MTLKVPPKRGIKTVGIVAKRRVLPKVKNLAAIMRLLKKKKIELLFDENIAGKLKEKKGYSRAELLNACDMVIVLGGDGTILKTAGNIGKKNTLILAVNYGNVGFLSESHPEDLEENLKKVFKGQYMIDKRSLLRVTHYRNGKKLNTFLAMNDGVINQGLFARLIELDIHVKKKHMVSFKADGLIISTPTGSTAHSLSAGGPIVYPGLDALVLTPICPAPLTLRPIVVPTNRDISITVATERREDHNLGLTIDGQVTVPLEYGDVIKTRRSSRNISLIRFKEYSYYETLREKLGWGKKPTH